MVPPQLVCVSLLWMTLTQVQVNRSIFGYLTPVCAVIHFSLIYMYSKWKDLWLQVFLISTRAGGLGLNLVSANRVVIFDPNWNPAQDLQAQDRSFRFGQKRHVTVFRFLSAGSLEELVYSRQVYKQQLSNIAVAGKTENRYFEGVQVKRIFYLLTFFFFFFLRAFTYIF